VNLLEPWQCPKQVRIDWYTHRSDLTAGRLIKQFLSKLFWSWDLFLKVANRNSRIYHPTFSQPATSQWQKVLDLCHCSSPFWDGIIVLRTPRISMQASQRLVVAPQRKLIPAGQLLINGRWRAATGGATMTTFDPTTEEGITDVAQATPADAD
jgi:hypothetical protein